MPDSVISFEEIMQGQGDYWTRQERLEPFRIAYSDYLCGDVPETYTTYLKTSFGDSNKRRFLTVAYQLSQVSEQEREQKFQQIVADIQEAIDEEVRHDGPDVMNMIGVADAIEQNKNLILDLAKTVLQRIQNAKIQMAWNGFEEFQSVEPLVIFMELVPYNAEALGYEDDSDDGGEDIEQDSNSILPIQPIN